MPKKSSLIRKVRAIRVIRGRTLCTLRTPRITLYDLLTIPHYMVPPAPSWTVPILTN